MNSVTFRSHLNMARLSLDSVDCDTIDFGKDPAFKLRDGDQCLNDRFLESLVSESTSALEPAAEPEPKPKPKPKRQPGKKRGPSTLTRTNSGRMTRSASSRQKAGPSTSPELTLVSGSGATEFNDGVSAVVPPAPSLVSTAETELRAQTQAQEQATATDCSKHEYELQGRILYVHFDRILNFHYLRIYLARMGIK